MGCLPTKLKSVSDYKQESDCVINDKSRGDSKTRSSSKDVPSSAMELENPESEDKKGSSNMTSTKETASKSRSKSEDKKENKKDTSKDRKDKEYSRTEKEKEKSRDKDTTKTRLKTDKDRSSKSKEVDRSIKEKSNISDEEHKEHKSSREKDISKSDGTKIKEYKHSKGRPILEKKSSTSKSKSKDKSSSERKLTSSGKYDSSKYDSRPIIKDRIVSRRPAVIKTNSFDEQPLTGNKNATATSWWDMDEANSSPKSIGSFESYKHIQITSRFDAKQTTQISSGKGSSRPSFNEQPTDITNEFLDKPSYNKTISSENINEVVLDKRSNKSYGLIKDTPVVRKNHGRKDDHFNVLNDDMNSSTGYSNKSNISELGDTITTFNKEVEQQEGPNTNSSTTPNRYNQSSDDLDSRPIVGRGYNQDDGDENSKPWGYERYSQNTTDLGTRPKPKVRPKFAVNTARQTGFGNAEDNDSFNSPGTLPSRPTNVPSRNLLQDDSDLQTSPDGFAPRPKFKRPAPLKRGAGLIARKAVPLSKSPREVMISILSRISTLEDSKFNEHLKLQKEFIDLMVKSPEVLSEMELDSLIKTGKKIVEVGSKNRTNLTRSSMICLGYMFEIIGSSLSGIVVDTLTLCAKKGVPNASELLVSSANFCFSRVCTKASEPKVSSQLVSLYKNNKAYQIITLSGAAVLLDRLGSDMVKLKNLDQIVDISVKGLTGGGVAARTVTRNILGMIQSLGKLDHYLNVCRCTEVQKMTLRQSLKLYDETAKDLFIEGFVKPLSL